MAELSDVSSRPEVIPDPVLAVEYDAGRNLGKRIASGAAWNLLAMLCDRLFAFLIFIIVVRHIDAKAVGIVTLAAVFVDVSIIIADGGLTDALVSRVEPTITTFSTAFWSNVVIGLMLTIAIYALAHPVALLYQNGDIEPVLKTMSSTFVIYSIGIVPAALLTRSFGFKALAARNITATVISGILAIALCYAGFGVWALVGQRVLAVVISTIAVVCAARWLPKFLFSWRECVTLMSFGLKVTGSTICHQMTGSVVVLILGWMTGSSAVGFYRVAQRLFDVVTQLTIVPLLKVGLTSMVSVRDDSMRFSRVFLSFTNAIALISIGIFFCLGALSQPVVDLIFGTEWKPSATILAAMSWGAVPMCCVTFLWPALTAYQKPGLLQRFGILEVVLAAALAVAASPWGMVAVAFSQVMRACITAPIALFMLQRTAGISALSVIKVVIAPTLAAAAMVFILHLVLETAIPFSADAIRIAISVPLGAALFSIFIALLRPHQFQQFWRTATSRLRIARL